MIVKDSNFELKARPELLELIESVAKDKNIDIAYVFEAMEAAIKKVAFNTYGQSYDIRAQINRNNGAVNIMRVFTVVEEVENSYMELTTDQAKKKDPDVQLGDEIVEYLPSINFTRSAVQSFRQVLMYRIREVEKHNEYEYYKNREGEIVSGVVRRIEFGNIYIELSHNSEAMLPYKFCIPREHWDIGNRLRALVVEVRSDMKSAQVILSRGSPEFVEKLFHQEIQEVYDNIIKIHKVVRIPGSRSKVAVYSTDPAIDPIATCVGFKGSRIHGILSEIGGEKIDLVLYSENLANYVVNAFYPIEVLKVVFDADNKSMEVVVKNEDLSKAVGRKGQNVYSISRLLDWNIALMTEDEEQEKRKADNERKVAYFIESLDVDDVIAQLLAVEGFSSVEDILGDNGESLNSIQAFSQEIRTEILDRAKEHLEVQSKNLAKQIDDLGIKEDLLSFQNLNDKVKLKLVENKVLSLQDFAALSIWELLDIVPTGLITKEEAEVAILKAREITEVS